MDVFGLAATHDLGIGQVPRRISRYVDAVYPMVYPSHYNPGEYNLPDPNAVPGETVTHSLLDFQTALEGRKARLDAVAAGLLARPHVHARPTCRRRCRPRARCTRTASCSGTPRALYDGAALQPPA